MLVRTQVGIVIVIVIVIGGLESGGLTTPIVGTERFCPAQKPTIT